MAKSASELLAEIDEVTDRLSLAADGFVHRVLRFITMDARTNGLRQDGWTFSEDTLREIAGRDSEKVPRLLQQLSNRDLALVEEHGTRCYRFPKLERVVTRRAEVNSAAKSSLRKKAPGLINPVEGIKAARINPGLIPPPPPAPAPAPFPSPASPILIPTPDPTPTLFPPTEGAAAAAQAVGGGARAPGRRRSGGNAATAPDVPGSPFVEFRNWWVNAAWPAQHHGEVYDFRPEDGKHLADILKSANLRTRDAAGGYTRGDDGRFVIDVGRAKRLALLFLNEFEGNYPGHTLRQLNTHLRRFVSKLAAKEQGVLTHEGRTQKQNTATGAAAGTGRTDSAAFVHAPGARTSRRA